MHGEKGSDIYLTSFYFFSELEEEKEPDGGSRSQWDDDDNYDEGLGIIWPIVAKHLLNWDAIRRGEPRGCLDSVRTTPRLNQSECGLAPCACVGQCGSRKRNDPTRVFCRYSTAPRRGIGGHHAFSWGGKESL